MAEVKPILTVNYDELISGEQFRTLFESPPGEPVLIRGVLSKEACKKWSHEEIRKRAGHVKINVDIFPDGDYKETSDGYRAGVSMTLNEYFDRLTEQANNPNQKEKMHMCDEPIYKGAHLGEITKIGEALVTKDIFDSDLSRTLAFTDRARHHSTLGFFGHNSRSPTHYHTQTHTFLVQLQGSKTIIFYPPSPGYMRIGQYYYDMIVNSALPEENRKAPTHGIFGTMPYRIEVTVEEGDMLFLPLYWWHDVYGNDYTITMSHFYSATQYQQWYFPSIHMCDLAAIPAWMLKGLLNPNKKDKGRAVADAQQQLEAEQQKAKMA